MSGKAIQVNPSYVRAHYNLGTLLPQTKAYQAALQPLGEAARLDPHSSDISECAAATALFWRLGIEARGAL